MKKCVASSSQGCYGAHANCQPTCFTAECDTCSPTDGSDYNTQWGLPTCSGSPTPTPAPIATTTTTTTPAPAPAPVPAPVPVPVPVPAPVPAPAPAPAGPRTTLSGCPCQQSWPFKGQNDCTTYCCNPDSDPLGSWCYVESENCQGDSWGYCAGEGGSAPAASGWEVVSGPCAIDNAGCASSPNYPNNYANGVGCSIDAGADSESIFVEHFKTEANYDILTINGVEYSGTDAGAPHNIRASGVITWVADSSVNDDGWRLCPNGQPSPTPPPPPAPATRRRWAGWR